MSVFQFCNEDYFLKMSGNNPGSNLTGNSGIPENGGSNPGGLPGGSSNSGPFGGYHTNRQIVHEDGSWSDTIRSIFIYGTGAIRFHLLRNGPPSQRIFILGGALIADGTSRFIQNAVNDPNYVLAHVTNWRAIWRGSDTVDVDISQDTRTENIVQSVTNSNSASGPVNNNSSSLSNENNSGLTGSSDLPEPTKNIIGGDLNLKVKEIFENIMDKIAEYLDYIFQPIPLDFPIQVMSNQIQNLSILLWILTICLCIFFISLLINITLYLFSDKLLKYFKNKYLLIYINFNKKVIVFEIIMLSIWIFYLLYILLTGLHYIAIHPVIFPV